jgi:hypothetical protein
MFVETLLFGAIITLLTQAVKKWIEPKYGSNGVILFVLVMAFLGGGLQYLIGLVPASYIQAVSEMMLYAVGLYEILYKGIVLKLTSSEK